MAPIAGCSRFFRSSSLYFRQLVDDLMEDTPLSFLSLGCVGNDEISSTTHFHQSEAVSLAGNVSLLSPSDVLSACYPHFMAYLKNTVSSEDHHHGIAAIYISKLKVSPSLMLWVIFVGKMLGGGGTLGSCSWNGNLS